MPDLLEFSLPIATADPEAAAVQEAVAWLQPFFRGGVVVEVSGFGPYGESEHAQTWVRGYLTDTPEHARLLTQLVQSLPTRAGADFYGEPQVRHLGQEDWAQAWKQHYHPLRVGAHILISPSWESPALGPDDILIQLDPGMAFGTGTHPSTQLALQLLETHLRPQSTVLDVGTGSGILGIAAVKLGAQRVVATDIDREAVRTAEENARRNQVRDRITLLTTSVVESGRFDLVVANILADVLADLLLHHHLAQRVAEGGLLILSGIIRARREWVDLALKTVGMEVVDERHDGDWIALAARWPSPAPEAAS